MKASVEQIGALTRLLGELEAVRRGVDLWALDRAEAAELIRACHLELGDLRVADLSGGGRGQSGSRQSARRRMVGAAIVADPDDMRHGTEYGYNHGCRCDRCRAAKSEAGKARRTRHT